MAVTPAQSPDAPGTSGAPGDPGAFGTTRRSLLTLAGAAAATATGAVAAAPAASAAASMAHAAPSGAASAADALHGRPSSYVTVRDGKFHLDGAAFRFGGTNCYYLHQQSHYMIDSALNDAAAMSLRVLRAMAFADGVGNGYPPLQPEPYVYDEAAFDSLDYAVYKAGQVGVRLVLVLTNNWPDYGGMRQYVTWFLGLPDDSYGTMVNHDHFYTDEKIKACYKAYAKFVVTRRNRYTGLRYNEDPAIMTFELANEPSARSDTSGATLTAWIAEMSAYVKKLAPRQLVATGDQGFYGDPAATDYPYGVFEGVRWKQLVALPHVDYATIHLYPGGWGENPSNKPGTDPVAWGTTWITRHLADAAALGKPLVLEEFGLTVNAAQGVADQNARAAGYQAWIDAVYDGGGAGDQFWLLTSRVDDGSYYPDYDGYRVVWDNDPSNPTNAIAQLLSAHAKKMAAG
jgi:mannan endo-1,4-beta-mannosidase